MNDLRKGYANTADGQLHYAEAGSGEHLLLLGETPRGYRFFEPILPLLAPHFHVIALDLPGLGNSHELPKPASVPAVAKCVASFFDALGIERAHVFGMHTGNKIAASFAADSPKLVEKLILAGQPHSIIPSKSDRNAALGPAFQRYRAAQKDTHDPQYRLLREWLATKLTLDAGWWPETILTGAPIDAGLIEAAESKAIDFLLGWRSAIPIYEAVFDFDLAEAVSRILAPTLILELSPPEEQHLGPQAGHLAALMKQAVTDTIPVTHGAAMENQGAEIARTILSFLGKQNPKYSIAA